MFFRLIISLLATLALSATAAPLAARPHAPPVTVGIVAINDFHGALEPPRQSVAVPDGKGALLEVPAGGAAWLASAIDSIRAKYPNHLTVSAGDLISASQFASSLYLDEPAIGVMNRIGLDFNAVGNHEFDDGRQELLRKQAGGCAQYTVRKPCQVEPFTGAKFRFLAASTHTEDGSTLFPATALKRFGTGAHKVTVGLIGLTLKDTPTLVSPDGIKGLTFADEADTINALVPKLKAQGADAIVVLIHQGGRTTTPDPNGCAGMTGDILPILQRLDPRVDVVVSGHTHWAYVCNYGAIDPAKPILLTSAGVYGELVTDIRLDIDPGSHRVVAKRAHNVIVQSVPYNSATGPRTLVEAYPKFAARQDIADYVKRYTDAAHAYSQQPAGRLAGPATRPGAAKANSGGPLGNLIADAQLAATAGAGAQIALTNPFGIRASLTPRSDGSLTFGDVYAVQPFANMLVTQSLTGAELKAVLEQGFDNVGPEQMLAPSAGFAYQFDRSRPVGERIVRMTLDGKPIDLNATYRVTTNSFLANGGDTFTALTRQRDAVIGMSDVDALVAWLKTDQPRAVPQEERVSEETH